MRVVRPILLGFFRRVVGIYFRDIEAAGNIPAPETGGRIFVGNHVNGLVDPILVLTSAPCPISPVAKSTLWKIPGLRFLLDAVQAVPLVRRRDDPTKKTGSNEEVFDRVAAWLAGGGNILIFPEGTSHNEPHLIQVKTGAARMLARAHARGAQGLTFQPVALEFDARDVFRSRCLLVYGPVRAVDDVAKTAASPDGLVDAITEQLRADLSELLVEGATWPERLLIARVAEMLANDLGDPTMARWNDVGRQVEAARKVLRDLDEAAVERIGAAVDRYYALLAHEGLGDAELAHGGGLAPAEIPLRVAVCLLALPIAAAAVVVYWLPYQLPRVAALRIANDPDEISTYKLATGLVVYPIWAGGLITAALLLTPLPIAVGLSALALIAPFVALAWRDLSRPLRRTLRLATRAERLESLRAARREAMAAIEQTRARLGM